MGLTEESLAGPLNTNANKNFSTGLEISVILTRTEKRLSSKYVLCYGVASHSTVKS